MNEVDRTLSIVIVIKTNQGGAWILPHIAEMRRRRHRVTVVLPPGDGRLRRNLDERGIPTAESPFDFSFRPRASSITQLLRLRRLLKRFSPDVVHYHLYASALAARAATFGLPVRRAHMVAGPLYLDSRLIRWVERVLVRLDDVLIAGSDHTADRYLALGKRPSQVVSIPYGVDTERFRPATDAERESARAELGLESSDVLFVMVAYTYAPKRLVYHGLGIKGHDVLLDAWQTVRTMNPRCRLLIVGGGFDAAGESHRQVLIERFGLDAAESGVGWHDSVADVRPIYAAADASVCPSLSENHGAALEATSSGVACIVSDAGALPETVDERTGWTVEAGDPAALAQAMLAAAADPDDLRRRGLLARERTAARFSSAVAASALVDTLEDRVMVTGNGEAPTGVTELPIALVTEARLQRLADSSIGSDAPGTAGMSWRREFSEIGGLRLVARVDPVVSSSSARPIAGEVLPLPYYVGMGQMVRALPRLVRAVDTAVAQSSVVVVRLPGPLGILAACSAYVRRRPFAAELVGDIEEVLSVGVGGRVGRALARPMAAATRWCMRKASASRYVTDRVLQDRYPPRPGSVSTSYTNVVTSPVGEPQREARPAVPRLITVGSQEQIYKGHHVLLRAVAQLLTDDIAVEVTIVGSGKHHDELRDLATSLGISDHVDFLGYVGERAALNRELDASTIFVLPSLTEGLPRALIEAMARGMPCIASDVGGTPELLDESALVTPGDPVALAVSIACMLDSDEYRHQQASRNLGVAARFSIDSTEAARARWVGSVSALASSQAR